MKHFNIRKISRDIEPAVTKKIDFLTNPKGSLGKLETLAARICLIQQTLKPELSKPHNILFAGDHGVIEEGVSVSPKEVTWQQLSHFSHGGAGINFLCDQHGFKLVLVDAGVDYDIPAGRGIIDCKIRKSTSNFLYGPAMTKEECELAIERGASVVDKVYADGCNVVSFGEMGSGNTSSSSMWMHAFTGIPLADCIGAGAGLDKPGVAHKLDVLTRAWENYNGDGSPESYIAWFGGFEMVMAVGGMLRAAELGMTIIVDGFIMTACILAASKLNPDVLEYALFGHQGDESGHKLMLQALNADPILHLGLRLGEGSGAVCAYPIIDSAVRMINEMDNFESVGVTKYF
ncbi:MAG: nicotinate-nucleotide--dimethylbenzimidazole phosphoribosyltransferase [Muribaculaceae bacterium]|nr:nicotinate-nucleotide--dimethylbenzimidazole phosphoribosyltransferase [Muribaculaceae bacterium]